MHIMHENAHRKPREVRAISLRSHFTREVCLKLEVSTSRSLRIHLCKNQICTKMHIRLRKCTFMSRKCTFASENAHSCPENAHSHLPKCTFASKNAHWFASEVCFLQKLYYLLVRYLKEFLARDDV